MVNTLTKSEPTAKAIDASNKWRHSSARGNRDDNK